MPMNTMCVTRCSGRRERVGDEQLPDDLACRQIALDPHGPRQAKRAAEAAADLGGQAQGEAIVVGHEHGAHQRAVGEPEDELAGCRPGTA